MTETVRFTMSLPVWLLAVMVFLAVVRLLLDIVTEYYAWRAERRRDLQACRECGCTEERACPGGCWWVERDLCSVCAFRDSIPPFDGAALADRTDDATGQGRR